MLSDQCFFGEGDSFGDGLGDGVTVGARSGSGGPSLAERESPISVVCVSTESVSVAGGGVAGEMVLVCCCD